jgi:hypothetical protein
MLQSSTTIDLSISQIAMQELMTAGFIDDPNIKAKKQNI